MIDILALRNYFCKLFEFDFLALYWWYGLTEMFHNSGVVASISYPISIAHSYSGELKVCVLWPLSPLHPFLSPWPMWPICSCLKMFILCRTITTSNQFHQMLTDFVLCCWDDHCNHFISVFTTIPSIFNTILTNIQMFVHQA